MALAELTDRKAVSAAIAKFRERGRDTFLSAYGFGKAREYFVQDGGDLFDSKPIAGVAYGFQFPDRGILGPEDFSGGEATVKAKLEELGFRVVRADDQGVPTASWAEVTSLEHGHGGAGWELGQWLWSPTTTKNGANRYAIMRGPEPGDQVYHLVGGLPDRPPRDRFLYGASWVASPAQMTADRPPSPGVWGDANAYFKIRLAGFVALSPPLPMGDLEAGLEELIFADLVRRPKFYPYMPYRDGFRIAQGIYLTRLTPDLADAFRQFSGELGPAPPPDRARQFAFEFSEGERAKREGSFFKRNPALRAAAIAHHGTQCIGCQVDLGERYGEWGRGLIEVHHLNPLAERHDTLSQGPRLTTVEDVVPLCPNCHRIVHRRRPALSIEELIAALGGG